MIPDPEARSRPITALAFDFGFKRIGLAVGSSLTGTAAPRPAVAMLPAGPDWQAISREIHAQAPQVLVVGVPYNADGSESAMAGAARRFARELGTRFGLPVGEVDERWSSLEAGAALKERRASGQRRKRIQKQDIDSAAAAVILTRWLAGEGQTVEGQKVEGETAR